MLSSSLLLSFISITLRNLTIVSLLFLLLFYQAIYTNLIAWKKDQVRKAHWQYLHFTMIRNLTI